MRRPQWRAERRGGLAIVIPPDLRDPYVVRAATRSSSSACRGVLAAAWDDETRLRRWRDGYSHHAIVRPPETDSV